MQAFGKLMADGAQAAQEAASSVESAAGMDLPKLLGVGDGDTDGYLRTKGRALAKELMSQALKSISDEEGVEPPPSAAGTVSRSSTDSLASVGLGGGSMQQILGPLVDGLQEELAGGSFKGDILEFASKRAVKAVSDRAGSLEKHGESLGNALVQNLGKMLSAQAQNDEAEVTGGNGVERAAAPSAAMEPAAVADSDGGSDLGSKLAGAVMGPLTTGMNSSLGSSSALQQLVQTVLNSVPLSQLHQLLKTGMLPAYQEAMKKLAPQLTEYGKKAGEKLIVYLKNLNQGGTSQADDQAAVSRAITRDRSSVEPELLEPFLDPFLKGMLALLARGDWMIGLFKSIVRQFCCKEIAAPVRDTAPAGETEDAG